MKKTLIFLSIISILSCTNINMEKPSEGYYLAFFNRTVNNIMVGYGDLYHYGFDKSNIPSADLSLFVMTFPVDYSVSFPMIPYVRPEYYKMVIDPDLTIENDITHYYNTTVKSSNLAMTKAALFEIEYRTEELKDFNIVSTSPIFGKNTGESLNSFFRITYIGPRDILISAANKKVLVDKSRENMPTTINELVASKVMVPSLILLKCISTDILTVPITTSFIIQMKVGEKIMEFETEPANLK